MYHEIRARSSQFESPRGLSIHSFVHLLSNFSLSSVTAHDRTPLLLVARRLIDATEDRRMSEREKRYAKAFKHESVLRQQKQQE